MAQTWPPKKWKVALLGLIDSVGRPIATAARGVRRGTAAAPARTPRRILVVELWQIGDVVLVTPFLRALRTCFPGAQISLLGKPHAAELLAHSGLVDDVIVADMPWTRQTEKYSPGAYDRKKLRALVRELRARQFDVSFDARMDIRSNILVSLSGGRRRIGFRHGGGDWLLTDAVPVDPKANHKIDDWLSLLTPVGCSPRRDAACFLRTTEEEDAEARSTLSEKLGTLERVIAIHPGGSHAGKRWPVHSFAALAKELIARGNSVITFIDPQGYGAELRAIAGITAFAPGLRGMMAILRQCAVLVCNDSGPMHVAAALGVPTVAIFERGEPRWFGAVGDRHTVVRGMLAGVAVSAAPYSQPPTSPVSVAAVLAAVLNRLGG